MPGSNEETLIIYGRQPVLEALRAGHPIVELWLARGASGGAIHKIEKLAGSHRIKITSIDKGRMQSVTGAVVHQGIAARVTAVSFLPQDGLTAFLGRIEAPFILVLDQIQDPHNLGAILRTAESCGVHLIVLPQKGSAPLNATVAKTSAGAMFHLQMLSASDLGIVLDNLVKAGLLVAATLPEQGQPLFELNLRDGLALVIGSEGKGVRKNLWHFCTHRAAIPQLGKINSLNASVAAGMAMYEAVRQRLAN